MTLELRNEPQQARSTATLNRLTAAATEIADEIGADRLTTADVAVRAGVSIGTIYRYFEDRVAILDAIDPGRTVAADVRSERRRQNEKWGEQNHPDGTGPSARPLATTDDEPAAHVPVPEHMTAAVLSDVFRRRCQHRFNTRTHGTTLPGTWADIFLEEVFEALAESDPAKLRAELVQVQAVAQAWAEAIDRRNV